ncbi:MAG TPA: hypothetical protein VLH56_17055 [Dissulfurispiraceae bacterium]|nr:hypothetical protein [Dissulfurispiraceae bacterium]
MIETNLQLSVKGLPEQDAYSVGGALHEIIQVAREIDEKLDLRRMFRIIITTTYSAELADLSSATASGKPLTHTDEEYAIGVAQVLILPKEDGFELLPVIDAKIVMPLISEESTQEVTLAERSCFHLLHHELCHVHDNNKKIEAFPELLLKHCHVGKDSYIRPLAEVCWCEFIANTMSSASAPVESIQDMVNSLAEAILRTKPTLDKAILEYRYHGDLDSLLNMFRRHGEFLIKTAAYVLGYLEGRQKQLSDFSVAAADSLQGSYFESTWSAMQTALKQMLENYPHGWKDLSIYDALAETIEGYYAVMGFILLDTDSGVYVEIPERPETDPLLHPRPFNRESGTVD